MNEKLFFQAILGLKAPWFVERVELKSSENRVDIWLNHEAGIQVACPECGEFHGLYDHGEERIFHHLRTCQMDTFIHVRLPRGKCPQHGVRQVASEFGENGSDMTYAFESHVLALAKECSVEAVGCLCGISWDQCWNAVERGVGRGQKRKPHRCPKRIGVDEKSFGKGQRYETLVYDIDRRAVDFVCDDRKQESLEVYYRQFTPAERSGVEVVAMDMWDPYIAATKAWIPEADRKIVFDHFHAMRYMLLAVDKVRKQEHYALRENGDETLKGSKYLWLWSRENVPEYRKGEFERLRNKDLQVCRAWAIKENLRHLWDYRYEGSMRKYFAKWYWWATHSRLAPVIRAARTLKDHLANIVTYARHQVTNALAEGLNSRIEKVKRMACGFRNREHYKTAIYFHCGGLDLCPKPPQTPSLRWRMA